MRRLFRFKYPKLFLLIVLTIFAYFLFSNLDIQSFVVGLEDLSYIGVFIAGIFFSFGFSAPFAVGFFLTANPSNIFIAAIIGGFGSMIADLTIFKIIRFSFIDEFRKLEKTKAISEINSLFSHKPLSKIKIYILYVFAGIIITSPLPDEVGVSMLAGLTKIKTYILAVISILLNTLGIFILIFLGS